MSVCQALGGGALSILWTLLHLGSLTEEGKGQKELSPVFVTSVKPFTIGFHQDLKKFH